MARILLREIAFARSGDKGSISNVGVAPYERRHLDVIREQVTTARVLDLYRHIARGPVYRYELFGIYAFNFVIHDTLDGGVSRSRAIDAWGKAYGSLILALEIDLPAELFPTRLATLGSHPN